MNRAFKWPTVRLVHKTFSHIDSDYSKQITFYWPRTGRYGSCVPDLWFKDDGVI